MKNLFGNNKKNNGSFFNEEESTEDILYPTMRNIGKSETNIGKSIKDEIKAQTSPFEADKKKKSGTLLGESIYDDDDDFKDLKFDFKTGSDKPKDDWISKQIAKEDE